MVKFTNLIVDNIKKIFVIHYYFLSSLALLLIFTTWNLCREQT